MQPHNLDPVTHVIFAELERRLRQEPTIQVTPDELAMQTNQLPAAAVEVILRRYSDAPNREADPNRVYTLTREGFVHQALRNGYPIVVTDLL